MTVMTTERQALDLAGPHTAGPVDLTPEQVRVLLMGMAENRVQNHRGNAYTEAWDIRRWLTRIFGFGGWALDTLELACLREVDLNGDGKRWTVIYRAQVRLTVRTADGRTLGAWDDAAMGDSQNQPQLGSAHDQAMKTALSQALKRCAVNLGDQFGLSLYNNGSPRPVVLKSVAHPLPAAEGAPLVPEQDAPVMPEPSPDPAPEQPAASPESYRPGEDNAEARPDARVPLPPAERTQPAAALPPRRDYMAEAKAAQSPQEFDRIRASAVAAGCSDEYADALDRIAAGRRAAARQQRQQAAGPETLPGAPGTVNDRLDAIAALYAAGEAAGLSQVETRDLLAKETGRTLGDATPTHLANVTADLRAAGGAR